MNTDEMTLNSKATPITPPDPCATPASPVPSMKWYRAVMAFIWVSAIFYIGYFGMKSSMYADGEIKASCGKTMGTLLLIFSFLLAVFAYIVWRELYKKSLLAPKLLLIWHILAIVCWVIQLGVILHHAGFDEEITETVEGNYSYRSYWGDKAYFYVRWNEIQALVAIVCNAVLLVVNYFYFRKRSDVFRNGDGSIGSLFRWQKKPAPAEVAEHPGETVTGTKKLPVRRHRVTRIIAWISAIFGAVMTLMPLWDLFEWYQEKQGNSYFWGTGHQDEIREALNTRILLIACLVLLNIAAILYAYVVWSGLLEHKVGTPGRIIPLYVFNLSFWIQFFVRDYCRFYSLEEHLEGQVKIDFGDAFVFWIVILIHATLAIPSYFYFKKRAHQFEN